MESTMRRTLIRYKAKPEAAERNAELVTAVFAELKAAQPQDMRYLVLRLEDDSFIRTPLDGKRLPPPAIDKAVPHG